MFAQYTNNHIGLLQKGVATVYWRCWSRCEKSSGWQKVHRNVQDRLSLLPVLNMPVSCCAYGCTKRFVEVQVQGSAGFRATQSDRTGGWWVRLTVGVIWVF